MPRDMLRSQRLRLVNHQGDALRLGMNSTEEDAALYRALSEGWIASARLCRQ